MQKKKRIKIKDLQIEDTKVSTKFIIIVLLIVLIVLFLLNMVLDATRDVEKTEKETEQERRTYMEVVDKTINEEKEIKQQFFSLDDSTLVKMYLPAVDAEGKGVNTALIVEATSGSGRTLTDIDNLLFWADTQHSIRIARRVAENITGKKMEDYDIIYTIEANASLIGGPSAGSALAIATIAALEKKKPKEDVIITGSINHDGTIGPVSAILEKAKAAKEIGATLFLVPLLQSRDVIYETSEHCEVFGHTEICTTETRPRKITVEEEAGIDIEEVDSVQEAMGYFFE